MTTAYVPLKGRQRAGLALAAMTASAALLSSVLLIFDEAQQDAGSTLAATAALRQPLCAAGRTPPLRCPLLLADAAPAASARADAH